MSSSDESKFEEESQEDSYWCQEQEPESEYLKLAFCVNDCRVVIKSHSLESPIVNVMRSSISIEEQVSDQVRE